MSNICKSEKSNFIFVRLSSLYQTWYESTDILWDAEILHFYKLLSNDVILFILYYFINIIILLF